MLCKAGLSSQTRKLHNSSVRTPSNFVCYNETSSIHQRASRPHTNHVCRLKVAPDVCSRGVLQMGRTNRTDRTRASRVKRASTQRNGNLAASAVGPLSEAESARTQHVVLLDLDNCMHIFSKICREVPSDTAIRGFVGISSNRARLQSRELLAWVEKVGVDATELASAKVGTTVGRWPVYVTVCGGGKDAADFILSLELGRLDQALPKDVPLTIISSDQGFDDVLRCVPDRPTERVDPRVRKGSAVLRHFSRLRSTAAAKALVAASAPAPASASAPAQD
mmetsp:Transcript_23081/g.50609  ORF Transcript_23081/g.50609 Transcript_23081/m.50609 type:complete len:279 (+) Transcript_23081:22-858(+)